MRVGCFFVVVAVDVVVVDNDFVAVVVVAVDVGAVDDDDVVVDVVDFVVVDVFIDVALSIFYCF